jgi:hypothetical protein
MSTEAMNKLMFYDFDYTLFFRRAYRAYLNLQTVTFPEQIMNRVRPSLPASSNNISPPGYVFKVLVKTKHLLQRSLC